MQTFLPHPDFERSLSCLDPSRLGNQVWREAVTLLRGGWPNHPASKMWAGYRWALAEYILIGVDVLLDRTGRDYFGRPWHLEALAAWENAPEADRVYPPWLGDERLHASHRAVLLAKDREWYGRFGWRELPAESDSNGRLPYWWPV